MSPRAKWQWGCIAIQVPLHLAAFYWISPWAVLPVLLVTNGARMFFGPRRT